MLNSDPNLNNWDLANLPVPSDFRDEPKAKVSCPLLGGTTREVTLPIIVQPQIRKSAKPITATTSIAAAAI
jgi:hypothetical protein